MKKEKVEWWDVPPVEPPEYFYRFWDDKGGCHLDKIRVHRRTKYGAWLCTQKPNGLQAFVLDDGKKKFAYLTIEEAKVSFLARKRWQLIHLKNTTERVTAAVKAMNEGELVLFGTSPGQLYAQIGQMVLPKDKDKDDFMFDHVEFKDNDS